jgi:uncharacterized membrane protein YraQ (UPF0718 family)
MSLDPVEEKYSLNSLIKNSMNNYEILINKYEKLLIDNTTLNVLIKDKLDKLPVGSEVRKMLEELMAEAKTQIASQQTKLSEKEANNKQSIDDLIRSLSSHVDKLLNRLNYVLACIVIGAIVGGAATYYVKSVIDIAAKDKVVISNYQQNGQGNGVVKQ